MRLRVSPEPRKLRETKPRLPAGLQKLRTPSLPCKKRLLILRSPRLGPRLSSMTSLLRLKDSTPTLPSSRREAETLTRLSMNGD